MYRIFFAFFGITAIIIILAKVRNNRFSAGRSIFWVSGGFLILFLSLFPKTIDKVAKLLDVYYSPSLLFLIALLFIIYSVFKLEEESLQTKEKLKDLAQKYAILENSIREGSDNKSESSKKDFSGK